MTNDGVDKYRRTNTWERNYISRDIIETKCDVLFLQETHRAKHHNRPKVNGMKLVVKKPH